MRWNSEVCNGHDEDCNPSTLGFLDADLDGASSSACCNGTECGGDCNDSDSTPSTTTAAANRPSPTLVSGL
jgi:hypothetical protein